MPIFCEITYYIEIFQFLVFATKPEVIFRILIRYFRDQFMTICAHSETIVHLFWDCNIAQNFWSCIASIFNKKCVHSNNFKFTKNLVLFGKCEVIKTDKVCDFIILLAKLYIYRCKVQGQPPTVNLFVSELYKRYNIEKIINKNSIEFRNNWAPYLALFRGILS